MMDILYNLLVAPSRAFDRLREERGAGLGAFVFSAAALSGCVGLGALTLRGGGLPALSGLGALWLGLLVLGAMHWLLAASLMHAVASALGGTGRVGNMMQVVGASSLPGVFCTPAALLCMAPRSGGVQMLGLLFAASVLAFWTFCLLVLGVCRTYRLGAASAALSVLTPIWVMLIILCTILLLPVVWLALQLTLLA